MTPSLKPATFNGRTVFRHIDSDSVDAQLFKFAECGDITITRTSAPNRPWFVVHATAISGRILVRLTAIHPKQHVVISRQEHAYQLVHPGAFLLRGRTK